MTDDLIVEARRTAKLGSPDFTNSALLSDLADALAERDKEIANLTHDNARMMRVTTDEINRAEAAETKITRMQAQLDSAEGTIKHASIFVRTREKMHPDGLLMFDDTLKALADKEPDDG